MAGDEQERTMNGHAAPNSADYEEFIRLFTRSEPGLRAFIRSLLPGREHAEEVMQETCLALWRKFADFKRGTDFPAWACTVARFEVLKYRRRLARDRHVFNVELLELLAEEIAGEAERRAEERRALDDCLRRLAARQRELVTACYAPGVTIKGVAGELGKSATSLYKALNRIRIVLLECIEAAIAREAHP
jgi:RNA polymerase sigma-70 factor (ECF subfamily)